MSHGMKGLLKIILDRNENKLEAEISENQSGSRPGKGTREGIFNLRIIIQRYLEVQKPPRASKEVKISGSMDYSHGRCDCQIKNE